MAQAAQGAAGSAVQQLDQLPLSRFHWKLLAVSGIGWMFDAMDILIVGSVVAAVSREWRLDPTQAQWINTANLAGLFFGALASGFLADRLGRKLVFAATLLMYSIFNGLSAAATGVGMLMALRFLSGLGLGGELPVAATMVSEFMPAKRRGFMVVLLESFWAYGSVAAALIAFLVIPTWGWRAALLIGALPAFYAFVIRRALPESPRYLAVSGRADEAQNVIRAVAEYNGRPAPSAAIVAPPPSARVGVAALFSSALRRSTVMLWLAWFGIALGYYGLFVWLPTVFVRQGFGFLQSYGYAFLLALAQLPGHRSGTRPGRKVLIRTDGAGASHKFLTWLTGQRLSYSIGFGLPANTADLLTQIPAEVWTPA